jgi:hypothetical protein
MMEKSFEEAAAQNLALIKEEKATVTITTT